MANKQKMNRNAALRGRLLGIDGKVETQSRMKRNRKRNYIKENQNVKE